MASQGKAPWLSLCFGWAISDLPAVTELITILLNMHLFTYELTCPLSVFNSSHFLTAGSFFFLLSRQLYLDLFSPSSCLLCIWISHSCLYFLLVAGWCLRAWFHLSVHHVVCVYRQSVSLLVYFFHLLRFGSCWCHLIPPVMRHVGRLDAVTNLANAVKYVPASTWSPVSHWKGWCLKRVAVLDGCSICQMVSAPDPPRSSQETSHFFFENGYGLGFRNPLHPL